jgi:DnaJ-domain-containing protein 1
VVSGVGVQGPRLGETLVFSGRRLLGRLAPEAPGHGEGLLALLRAGLSPFVGKAGVAQWEDDESDDPFAIIGVDPAASLEEARAAWRRRLAEYHPDRFETAGAKIRRLALLETQRLNAAFEAITRLRRPSADRGGGDAR